MNYDYEDNDDHHGGYSLPAKRYVKGVTTNFCEDPNTDYGESLDEPETEQE